MYHKIKFGNVYNNIQLFYKIYAAEYMHAILFCKYTRKKKYMHACMIKTTTVSENFNISLIVFPMFSEDVNNWQFFYFSKI